MGFFREGYNLYPKSFKILVELQDANKNNYRKIKANGKPERVFNVYQVASDTSGGDFNKKGTVAGLDAENNDASGQLFPSKTKLWKAGE